MGFQRKRYTLIRERDSEVMKIAQNAVYEDLVTLADVADREGNHARAARIRTAALVVKEYLSNELR